MTSINKFRIIKVEHETSNVIKAVLQDEDDNTYTLYGKQNDSQISKSSYDNKCRECGKAIEGKFELCYSCNEDKRLEFGK